MRMRLLIDGNNLLYAAREVGDHSFELGRAALCALLRDWAERRRARIWIVFDGAPRESALTARSLSNARLHARFSGAGVSADSVIIARLEAGGGARGMVVVSTDREVARAARRYRAKPVRADVFWQSVQRTLARPRPESLEPPEKRSGLDPDAAQRWMRDMGLDPPPA